jgi:mannose-1-phosphate guanylyltransferase
LRQDPGGDEFGQIEIDESGRIRRILGQGDAKEKLRSLMFTGVHVIEPRFLEYIPPDVNTCVIRYGYTKAQSNDERLFGFVNDGYFADAGTPERYYRANADALEQRMPLRHIDPIGGFALEPKHDVAEVVRMGKDVELSNGVRLVPPVLLGDGVRLGEDSVVGPYAILRAGASVGKDAVVEHSIVLDDVKIDNGARVRRQLLAKKASLELGEEPGTV